MVTDFSDFLKSNAIFLQLEQLKQLYISGDKNALPKIDKLINGVSLNQKNFDYLTKEYLPSLVDHLGFGKCDSDWWFKDIKRFSLRSKFLGLGVKKFQTAQYYYQFYKTEKSNVYDLLIFDIDGQKKLFSNTQYRQFAKLNKLILTNTQRTMLIEFLNKVLDSDMMLKQQFISNQNFLVQKIGQKDLGTFGNSEANFKTIQPDILTNFQFYTK